MTRNEYHKWCIWNNLQHRYFWGTDKNQLWNSFSNWRLIKINLANKSCIWRSQEDEDVSRFVRNESKYIPECVTSEKTVMFHSHHGESQKAHTQKKPHLDIITLIQFCPRLLQAARLPWSLPLKSKHARASRICGPVVGWLPRTEQPIPYGKEGHWNSSLWVWTAMPLTTADLDQMKLWSARLFNGAVSTAEINVESSLGVGTNRTCYLERICTSCNYKRAVLLQI